MPLIGSNIKVELQKTLGTEINITSISKANPAVVTTATAHGYVNGDIVVLSVAGMDELDGVAARIANVAASTFELEGVDSTAFSKFSSGTVSKVTAWDSIAWAQSINLPNGSPTEIDITTLIHNVKQYAYGMPDAPKGTIEGIFEPNDPSMANLRAATASGKSRVFRVTWPNGANVVFNANISAGQGFNQPLNGVATTTVNLTIRGFANFYNS